MPYIGREPQVGNYQKLDSIASSFNGSTTTFNLTIGTTAFTAGNARQLIISIAGVLQEPESAYTVSGSTITFTQAPASGDAFFGIALGDTLDIGVPTDGSVDSGTLATDAVVTAKIQDGAVGTSKITDKNVTTGKLADAAVTAAKVAATGLGANTLATNAVTTAKITDLNVTTAKLAEGAVTGAKIAASGISSNSINAGGFSEFDFSASNNIIFGMVTAKRGIGNTQIASATSSTFTPEFDKFTNFIITLGASTVTLQNDASANTSTVGQSGFFLFKQDASGTRALGLQSDYKTAAGGGITLSTAAGAHDIVPYVVSNTDFIVLGTPQLEFK